MLVIIEQDTQDTIFQLQKELFSQGTVKVLKFYFVLIYQDKMSQYNTSNITLSNSQLITIWDKKWY